MNYFENKTILVPCDFSDPAMGAIDKALEMFGPSSGMHVIHVVSPVPMIISMDPALPVPVSFDQDRLEHAKRQMEKMLGSPQYGSITRHCELGDPGTEIVKLANSIGADMIVMPSHGRKGMERLFMGSVAERVLRLANCPVLVLRGKD